MARSGGLGALTVDLLLETVDWVSGLNKAEYETEKFHKNVSAKFSQMGDTIAGSLKGLAVGFGAAFSVEAMVSFIDKTQAAADRMDELAQKTGTTVEFLTEVGEAARLSGQDIEAVAQSLVKLNKAIIEGKAKPESTEGRIFQSLNVGLTENGELRKTEEISREVMMALGALEDGAVKSAMALKLWGKAGAEMIVVANSMFQATEQQTEAWKALGVEQARTAKIAGAFEEQQQLAQTRTKEFGNILAQQFMPYLTKIYEQFNALTASGKGLGGIVAFLVNSFKVLIIACDLVVTALMAVFEALRTIGSVFIKIITGDWKGAIVEAMGTTDRLADTFGNFAERSKALINPLLEETRVLKEQTKATDEQKRAVEDLAKAKKLHVIDMSQFKPLEIKGWSWMDEEKGPKIDGDKIRDIMLRQQQINIKLQQDADREYFKWLESQWGDLYKGIESLGHNAFNTLFDDAKGGWKEMLNGMARDFKKLLMDMIWKQIAQPLILNLVATVGGGSGLGQYAQMLGMKDASGNLQLGSSDLVSGGMKAYDYFTGSSAAASENAQLMRDFGGVSTEAASSSGLFSQGASYTSGAGWGAGYGAAAGIGGGLFGAGVSRMYGAGERGQANATNYAATGAAIGMQVYGPIGAAVGAIIGTIVGISTDPDPDAMRKAKFGTTSGAEGLTQYKYESKLGSFGISDAQWFSDADMESILKPFMEGMKNLDNAIADTLKPEQIEALKTRLEGIQKEYEFGMEHGNVGGLGEILKDRLRAVVETVIPEFQAFFDAFNGEVEDLSKITAGYLQLRAMGDFDPDKLVADIVAENEAKASQMGLYQKGRVALEEQIVAFDGTAKATEGMVIALGAFQEATVAMVLAIDAAAEAMHNMFMDTADQIRQSVMSPEERYNYLQERSAKTFDLLATETDPAKIQQYADSINKDIMAAWNLLSPEQQAAQADAFLARIETLDQYVATKMGALHDVVVEDAGTIMQSVSDKLDEIFIKGAAAADKNLEAADKNVTAANTPVVVVVSVDDGGSVTSSG